MDRETEDKDGETTICGIVETTTYEKEKQDTSENVAEEGKAEEKVDTKKGSDTVGDESQVAVANTETSPKRAGGSPFLTSMPSSAYKSGTSVPNDAGEGGKTSISEEIDLNEIKRIQDEHESSNIQDEVLLKAKCKLFRKNQSTGKFDDRGEGQVFLTKYRDSGLYKVAMVRDQIKTLGCNHFIDPSFECVSVTSYKRAWSWFTSSDSCYTGGNDSRTQFYVIRFSTDENSEMFKKIYDEGMKANAEILNKK